MCRSRRKLSNAYLLAKIGVDTAENEPLEVWGENSIQYSLHSLLSMTRWVVFFGFRPEELGTRNIASKCVDVSASSRVAARLCAFMKDSYRFSLHSSSTAEQRIDQGSGRRRYLRDRRFLLRQPDSQKSRHEKKSRGDRERELGSPQRVPEIFVDTENHLRRDNCRKHLEATVERTGTFSVLLRLKAL